MQLLTGIGTAVAVLGIGTAVALPESRDALVQFGREVGVFDTPPPRPIAIDLIIDVSEGSSGRNIDYHAAAIDALLGAIADAPGSMLRITLQGARALDAAIIGTIISTTPPRRHRRSRAAHRAQFIAAQRARLLPALQSTVAQQRAWRNSPIAETASWTTQQSLPPSLPPETERHLIILTDALEVSPHYGDFECGPLPTPDRFLRKLQRRGAFAPGSLAATHLVFIFVEPRVAQPPRCPPMTLAHLQQVRTLWETAGATAGAIDITFHSRLMPPPISTEQP
ncbi:hypothetical protein HYV74_04880 [Candidatus Uhrbacteria bacterium]|nr:hypothetical protein [Candidatus Uhrbacteria bacterium]